MMKNIYSVLMFAVMTASIASCKMDDNDPYHVKIRKERYSKDSFFKVSNQSPFDLKAKREISELPYFNPDIKYDVKGHLELLDTPKPVRMAVSNSAPEAYFNLGKVVFDLNGTECKLSIFQNAKSMKDPQAANELFCPFTDETSGKETYGSGRFLDLQRNPGSNDIEVDFNAAYNPYCAYNHEYSCPIPPMENHLDFRVEAGEKKYKTGRFSFFK